MAVVRFLAIALWPHVPGWNCATHTLTLVPAAKTQPSKRPADCELTSCDRPVPCRITHSQGTGHPASITAARGQQHEEILAATLKILKAFCTVCYNGMGAVLSE